MKFKSLMVLALVALFAVSAVAQDQTGSIFGSVKTEDGAAIVGAKVTAASAALIRPLVVRTNDRGSYVFPALPIGTYTITFEADQYQGVKQEGVSVNIGNQLRFNQVLKTGDVGEEVITITGEAPLVDVKSTDTSMNISKELFQALPKGRNFASMVALAPGASDEGDRFGGIMIDGASSSENVWVIDGAGTNDLIGGRNAQGAVFEFVEEIQVRSGGYEAEFGGSMGGVVNVVTRSGGNEFHGSLNGYWSGDKLNANPRKTLRRNPVSLDDEYVVYPKTPYDRYDIGGSLGGYVIKDHVWFFGSYMPWFEDLEKTVTFIDGDGYPWTTQTFTRERQQHNAAAKLSAQVTDKLRVAGSFSTDWYKSIGELPSYQGTTSPENYSAEKGYKYPGYVAAGSIDYLLSDELYFNAKIGWHQVDTAPIAQTNAGIARYLMSGSFPSLFPEDAAAIPAQYRQNSGYNNITWAELNAFEEDFQLSLNGSGDITMFAEGGGSHMLKGGLQWYWIKNRVADGNTNQYYTFYWREPGVLYSNPITGETGRGKYGWYRVLSYDGLYGLNGEASSNRYALFLQDSWGVTERLTMNIGIRAEQEKLPSYDEDFEDPLDFGFADKIAPRVGISYDLFGDGKVKLFANWGIYYDVMKLEMAREGYGGRVWKDARYTLDTLEWWTFPDVVDPSQYPGSPIGPPVNWRIPALETTDPDCEPMEQWEYIGGFDWQFADNMAVNVRLVYKTLKKTIEDIGIITPEGEEYWHGNPGYGRSKEILEANGYPNVKAVRDYMGLDIRLIKRFSNNWTGGINFTVSKLRGNYSGLTNTDEDDRDSPNVNRNFDLWWMTFDQSWGDNIGPLQSDRRYAATIFGSYAFDKEQLDGLLDGLVIGFTESIVDGLPFSTEVQLNGIQGVFPFGRGDMGRHPMVTQTDIYAEYNFELAEGYRAQFNINVTNLFDQDTVTQYYRVWDRDTLYLSDEELLTYYQTKTPIPYTELYGEGTGNRIDSLFGKESAFQGARSIRLGFKFTF
jgi:hypothetical protein